MVEAKFFRKGNTLVEIIIVLAILGAVIRLAMLDNPTDKKKAPLQVTQDKIKMQEGNIKRQKAISNLEQAPLMNAVDGEPFEPTVEGAKKYFRKSINVVKETKEGFYDTDGIYYRFVCSEEKCKVKIKTDKNAPESNFPINIKNTKVQLSE